jgi:DNA replication ATP-dependent helicase Dna2
MIHRTIHSNKQIGNPLLMGYLLVVQKIENNLLEGIDKTGKKYSLEVKLPWLQFLTHLTKFDQIYVNISNNIIDENGYLVIEPHYLIAVTRAIDALNCPRKNYVKTLGAEEITDRFLYKRMTQGNLLHSVFSQKLTSDAPIEDVIQRVVERSELELLTVDMSKQEASNYLNKDARVLRGLSFQGETEIDCQNWEYGLHGKFDGIGDQRIIELKTSKIPDVHPWRDHNLQMTAYIHMIEKRGIHKGSVLYVRDQQMGLKSPTPIDLKQIIIGRNYAFLVLSGKLVPPVLRGEKIKECRNCFVKFGCKNLCAGLDTQRDCQSCYHEKVCDQTAWKTESQDYFKRLTTALLEEEAEENREQHLFSHMGKIEEGGRSMLYNRGFATITTKKIAQERREDVVVTTFEQQSKMSRFRRGDMARVYDLSDANDDVTLFHSVIITDFSPNTVTLESTNMLPDRLGLVPISSSSNPRTGRRALFRSVTSPTTLVGIIRHSLQSHINLETFEIQDILIRSPLQVYNSIQQAAIMYSLATPDLFLIQGPAGTGKTSVIVEIIHQLHIAKKTVLCSAFTNMAVDNVGIKLKEFGIPFIRLGNLHSMNSELQDKSALAQPELFKEVVNKQRGVVVLATTSTIARSNYEDFWFDYVLLDEAAQMTEPDALKAILLGEKAVMVGDHAQLQPIITSNKAQQLKLHVSLFERLVNMLPERFLLLTKQYRMNDEILDFPNRQFYNGALESANSGIGQQSLNPFTGKFTSHQPYEVISIEDTKHNVAQQVNHSEGVVILAVLFEILENNPDLSVNDIGVITPFRAQVAYLRALLPGLNVDTVDRYQGSEREIIIYSTITIQEIPILTDPRRLNVALTRAKKKLLILLTNPDIKRKYTLLDALFQDSLARGVVTHITMDQVKELRQSHQISQHQQKIRQFSASDMRSHYKNFEERLEVSLGIPTNIFFKAIQLMEQSMIVGEICSLCLAAVEIGIQCIGCSSWYHEEDLRKWLDEHQHCPVCKNTLFVVEKRIEQ